MSALLPFQQRVVDEASDLEAKLDALTAFTGSAVFRNLPDVERELLMRQGVHMTRYLMVLKVRIDHFQGATA